jgi:hypothetical protein
MMWLTGYVVGLHEVSRKRLTFSPEKTPCFGSRFFSYAYGDQHREAIIKAFESRSKVRLRVGIDGVESIEEVEA